MRKIRVEEYLFHSSGCMLHLNMQCLLYLTYRNHRHPSMHGYNMISRRCLISRWFQEGVLPRPMKKIIYTVYIYFNTTRMTKWFVDERDWGCILYCTSAINIGLMLTHSLSPSLLLSHRHSCSASATCSDCFSFSQVKFAQSHILV